MNYEFLLSKNSEKWQNYTNHTFSFAHSILWTFRGPFCIPLLCAIIQIIINIFIVFNYCSIWNFVFDFILANQSHRIWVFFVLNASFVCGLYTVISVISLFFFSIYDFHETDALYENCFFLLVFSFLTLNNQSSIADMLQNFIWSVSACHFQHHLETAVKCQKSAVFLIDCLNPINGLNFIMHSLSIFLHPRKLNIIICA